MAHSDDYIYDYAWSLAHSDMSSDDLLGVVCNQDFTEKVRLAALEVYQEQNKPGDRTGWDNLRQTMKDIRLNKDFPQSVRRAAGDLEDYAYDTLDDQGDFTNSPYYPRWLGRG